MIHILLFSDDKCLKMLMRIFETSLNIFMFKVLCPQFSFNVYLRGHLSKCYLRIIFPQIRLTFITLFIGNICSFELNFSFQRKLRFSIEKKSIRNFPSQRIYFQIFKNFLMILLIFHEPQHAC